MILPSQTSAPALCRRFAMASLAGVLVASAAQAGTVTVRSSEDGEVIFMDGKPTGLQSPAVLRNVPEGRHVFEVRSGCRVGKSDVQIPADGKVVVNIETSEAMGSLLVQPNPANATVKLDNAPFAGTTQPQEVACGRHSVAVTKPGYIPAFVNVDVPANDRVVLPVKLGPMGMGMVTISVSPSTATIVLDGSQITSGTRKVPAGAHVLRLTADGRQPEERQFILEDGGSLSFDFSLSPGPSAVAAAPPPKPAKPPKEPRQRGDTWWTAPHTAGVGASAVGVGLGVVSVIELSKMVTMGQEYAARVDEVNAAQDYSQVPPSYANNYRDNKLLPQRNKAVALTAVSAVLLGSGLTFTLAF